MYYYWYYYTSTSIQYITTYKNFLCNTLNKINSKYGNYSVLGNHDYCDYVGLKRNSQQWKDNFNNMLNIHKNMGFNLLLNESKEIEVENVSVAH